MFEPIERYFAEALLEMYASKGTATVRIRKADWPAPGASHLGLNILFDAGLAEEVHGFAITTHHSIEWHVIAAARALLHLPSKNGFSKVLLLFLMCLFLFATFCGDLFTLPPCCCEFLRELASGTYKSDFVGSPGSWFGDWRETSSTVGLIAHLLFDDGVRSVYCPMFADDFIEVLNRDIEKLVLE